MKMNKWTLGLAAVGLVSLTSAVRADEAKTTPLLTGLSSVQISGYVDTSAVWNPGSGNIAPAPFRFNAGKQDGFNIDSVDVKISKPLEEGQWSSGFVADLMFGPDAGLVNHGDVIGNGHINGLGISDIVRQAYLSLRMPVGNGIDWKIGRFDCALGYESTDAYKDPNFTRSYGYTFEPTEHTGIMAEYKVNDTVALSAGVANTVTTEPLMNARSPRAESKKAVMGMINLTAPESWGAIGGSGLYAGIDYGPGAVTEDRTHIYVGATIKTPVQGLTLGAAWDSINHMDVAAPSFASGLDANSLNGSVDTGYASAIAVYASFKLTDKASIHLRGEYAKGAALGALADIYNGTGAADFSGTGTTFGSPLRKVIAVTGTLQYDLWQNVISRLEVRWDHQADGAADAFGGKSFGAAAGGGEFATPFGGATVQGGKRNDVMVAANLIFKF